MRTNHERVVTLLEYRIVRRDGGHVGRRPRERMPRVAAIVREVHAAFVREHENARVPWMFANSIDGSFRETRRERAPRRAEILADEHEGPVVVCVMPVERDVY